MTDFIYTTTDYGHVPFLQRPDTFEPGRVCCRCHFTVLSIYNGEDACWQCWDKAQRELAAREAEVRGRLQRMPRERVTA